MGLGLSIYPAKAKEKEIINYLEKASKYGYDWIFTSLLAIHEQSDSSDKLKRIIKRAKDLGYKIQVDVSPAVFKALDLEPTDLSYFHNLGVNAIRLDEPFNGQVESIMTFNPYGIDIIINASSDLAYIDLILGYQANPKRILACHNFYPQRFTGLSKEHFLKTTNKLHDLGIRTAAFINGPSGKICSSYDKEGVCTIEEHREKSVISQARELKHLNIIDDIYFSTMFIDDEELAALSQVMKENIITIDVNLDTEISELERNIIEDFHFYRGDISDYMIRSTMMRVKYKDQPMVENNVQTNLKRGDIVILNDNYENYSKELHIVLKEFSPNNNKYNVVGHVNEEQLVLIDLLKPWSKFKLEIK